MSAAHYYITAQAALPGLPCLFTLKTAGGAFLGTVRGAWTLDDDAVRDEALRTWGADAPARVQHSIRHAHIKPELLRGRAS